jgi:hypothetical protein
VLGILQHFQRHSDGVRFDGIQGAIEGYQKRSIMWRLIDALTAFIAVSIEAFPMTLKDESRQVRAEHWSIYRLVTNLKTDYQERV